MAETSGLRERRKQQTRQAISDSATRLFLERGFDEVTIADVAAAAGVAKMTVTNYFPRKEDLALDAYQEVIDRPARAVAERRPGESALAAVRRAHEEGVARRDPVLGFCGQDFARMIVGSPALLARLREIHEQQERALADALAGDAGNAGDAAAGGDALDLSVRTAAMLLGGVHRILFQEAVRQVLTGRGPDEVAKAVSAAAELAFGMVEPSLGHYAIRPANDERAPELS
ncbi:transcriptional regulator, TetR family [Streptoalloteichus tenebrarius]|uniref:Transcriptional regulator, TetR family n=1 Tax=Streptoalloteichus tenebrarius (strain ATCC 17920 / DSM 40477 / JCM 4838 / CBS 697.72 / NBRC 16177 / NCIMB 11028 / NRRL B-12390 / A12253. 1 / ISP 5477) TaxID=1933 RepID=A0ABT1HWV0_STRSD|nr:TetR family transcriptional regulator [Streptoalloteichus tenebrarius]MCP2259987.1 transcriptional regulator, TetR family [Streptoalloteichus tenebrarius]BFF03900.1 TetR family transcriptional regulator [Streptoalloteichus tenebrarius]